MKVNKGNSYRSEKNTSKNESFSNYSPNINTGSNHSITDQICGRLGSQYESLDDNV